MSLGSSTTEAKRPRPTASRRDEPRRTITKAIPPWSRPKGPWTAASFASRRRICDGLFRLYGSDDYNEAMGASFAVENWAAAGFWKELIAGLEKIKDSRVPDLPLAFFTWHDKI